MLVTVGLSLSLRLEFALLSKRGFLYLVFLLLRDLLYLRLFVMPAAMSFLTLTSEM